MAILNSEGKREGVELTRGRMVHRGAGRGCRDGGAVSVATSPCWEKNSGGGRAGPKLAKILSMPLFPCPAPRGLRERRGNPCLRRRGCRSCSCMDSSLAPPPSGRNPGLGGGSFQAPDLCPNPLAAPAPGSIDRVSSR